jgi:predicted nucleic acid-binding protein
VPDVVVDTSVVQYLHQARLLDLLPALYGVVTVPYAVAAELARGREVGINLPDVTACAWMRLETKPSTKIFPMTKHLGAGELDAIGLALERSDSLVLLDDRLARQYAARLGLRYSGTLGVLLRAKREGLVATVRPALDQLVSLGFRLASETRVAVLQHAGEDE